MVAVRDIEAHPRRNQHVLLLEQIERELLIIEIRQLARIEELLTAYEALSRRLSARETVTRTVMRSASRFK